MTCHVIRHLTTPTWVAVSSSLSRQLMCVGRGMCVCVYDLFVAYQHILDITLYPKGEWLVCACLDRAVYIIPLISLTHVSSFALSPSLLPSLSLSFLPFLPPSPISHSLTLLHC